MSNLRRPIRVLLNELKLSSPRSFHVGPKLSAKQNLRRAPSVIAKTRQSQSTPGVTRVKKTFDSEESLPPILLLQSASKSGVLSISPEKAIDVLRRYQELEGKSGKDWEQKLCAEFDISPSILVLLSRILNRCSGDGQRHLARRVLLSASELGEESAILDLISYALRKGDFRGYEGPIKRLGLMAKLDGNPRAMTLLARLLYAQGENKEALNWVQKATRGASGVDFEEAGEALVNEGRLLQALNNKEEAEFAFRKAAFELDDPSAYFYLSQLHRHDSSRQQVYLLKAASSGIVEAWHNLGSMELARLDSTKDNSSSDYGMAREWFAIAAADGFGPSMINLAQICKAGGQLEEGLKWLEKAKEIPEVREEALSMKSTWTISENV